MTAVLIRLKGLEPPASSMPLIPFQAGGGRIAEYGGCCTTPQMRRVKMVSAAWYPLCGGVSELADEHDLGSCAARRAGSSPAFPTTITLCFLPQIWPTRLQQAPSNAEG